MRIIPPAMQAHLNRGTTHLVMCWKLTPKPPHATIGFTENGQSIIHEGVTYVSDSGLSVSALQQRNQVAGDNMEADFFLNLDDAQADDLRAGVFDDAIYELFLIDALQPDLGTVPLLRGSLSGITFSRNQLRAEIVSLSSRLQQNLLVQTSPTCRAHLGDKQCRVKLAVHTVTGQVTKIDNNNQGFTDDKRGEATNHFNQGLLTWLSGNNQGLIVDIKRFKKGGTFSLFEPLIKAIQVGDKYRVVRGCDKTIQTCETVFNNVVNFRGEPHLPGNDQIFKVGGQ